MLSKEDEDSIIDFILAMPQNREGTDSDDSFDEETNKLMTDFLSSYGLRE